VSTHEFVSTHEAYVQQAGTMEYTWEYTVVHTHTQKNTHIQSRNCGRSYIYRSTVQNAADWELDVHKVVVRATSSSSDFRPACAPEITPSSASHTVVGDSIGLAAELDTDSACCGEVQSQGVSSGAKDAVEDGGRCGQGTGTTAGGMKKDETLNVSTAHTSVSRAQNEGLRNSAWMFALFVGFSLVATAPRCITLLCISSFVPQAPMPAALDDFKAMWAPCKDPTVLFPAFSPGGILYKCLATADDVFSVLGTTIQHLCVCRVWFGVKDFDKGTAERKVLSILQHLTTALFMVPIVFMGTLFVGSARSSWNQLMWGPGAGPGLPGAVERVKMGPNYTTIAYYYTTAIVCCGLASITKWDVGVGVGVGVGMGVILAVGVGVVVSGGVGCGVAVAWGGGVGCGVVVAVVVLLRRGRFEWCSWGNAKLDQFKLVVFFGASALLHCLVYEQIAFSFSALRGIPIIYLLLAGKACSSLSRFLLTRCLLESCHCDMGFC
jgi:hypothetical protein